MGEKHQRPVSRRETLALLGTALLAGGATGGATARTTGTRQNRTVRAYVGSYHWGYFMLDSNGEERDQLGLSPGDELRITAFNVESDEAIAALPGPVRGSIPSSDARARRNEQSIPVPQGVSLEDLHEAAEAAYPDHSLAVVADEYLWTTDSGQGPGGGRGPGGGQGPGGGRGPSGGHHGPGHHGGVGGPGPGGPHQGPWRGDGFAGMMAPPTYLWHHSTVPSEVGFVVEDTGSFGFACTVYCGYGHPYMAERGRVVVEE